MRLRATLERRFDRCRGRAVNTGIELESRCNDRLIVGIPEDCRAALAL
jgi:hypothetical protein